MFKYDMGYRFQNGEVMGFTGYGFDTIAAINNAHSKIINKLEQLEETFHSSNELHSQWGLTKEEINILEKDWKNN